MQGRANEKKQKSVSGEKRKARTTTSHGFLPLEYGKASN
jgi:hypothetical protein